MSALPVRIAAGAGLAAGLVLLARPDAALDRLAPRYPRDKSWVVRLLGARLVAQHAMLLAAPAHPVLRVSAAVDLLHAASMLPLVGSARYGRAARISGGVAGAYGLFEARA